MKLGSGLYLFVVVSPEGSFNPPYFVSFGERLKVLYMGDKECLDANVMVGDVDENGEMSCERIFTVGEVVEFWEGAYVSGKRSDSGEPAFVKRVEGNGVYSIKMVGSARGKFRKAG